MSGTQIAMIAVPNHDCHVLSGEDDTDFTLSDFNHRG